MVLQDFTCDTDVPHTAFRIAVYVRSHAERFRLTQAAIARALGMHRSTVLNGLAKLEELGYAFRIRNYSKDGRQPDSIKIGQLRRTPEQWQEAFAARVGKANVAEANVGKTDSVRRANSKKSKKQEEQLSEGTTANAAPAPEFEPTPEEDVKLKPPVDAPGLFEMAAPPKPPAEPSAKDVVGAYVDAFRAAHGRDPLKQDKSRIGRDSGGLLKRKESTVAELILCAREMGKGIHANMATQLKIHRGTGAKPANNSISSLPILNGDPRWDEAAEQTRREGAELLAANADAWDGVFA